MSSVGKQFGSGGGGQFSAKQKQMLELASAGLTDKEISAEMGLSLGTLSTYWSRMRRKLRARSRSELIAKIVALEVPALSVLRRLPLFVWTLNADGQFDFLNDWFFTRGGLSVHDAKLLGCRAMMPESELAESSERWRRAQQTGEGYEAMVHFRVGPEGELRRHKVRLISVRDEAGTVVRWIGYARELAESADENMALFLREMLAGA